MVSEAFMSKMVLPIGLRSKSSQTWATQGDAKSS